MKSTKVNKLIKSNFKNYWFFAFFIILFVIQIFTRFEGIDTRSGFGWDQVDNAWAAKNIIIDHNLPLVGMQAKGNTGFYIGPYYYYLIVPFYLLTNMHPIASGIIAGVTSLLTFFVIFFVSRRIFNESVAIIALFISTFSSFVIGSDRVQWPVNFIVPISFLMFYALYKIATGYPKYVILLLAVFGFSLHIHFTSIFYIPIVVLSLPLFPRTRKMLKYLIISFPLFVFFIFPIITATLIEGNGKAASYVGSSYLGIHLRRILQVAHDGFIQFESIINVTWLKFAGYFIFPTFLIILLKEKLSRHSVVISYLCILWILIPWFAFSTYSGEITDYYFYMTRVVVLFALSYLLYKISLLGNRVGLVVVILVLVAYGVTNFQKYLQINHGSIKKIESTVQEKIDRGEKVEFSQGNPESYLYFILKERYDKKQ